MAFGIGSDPLLAVALWVGCGAFAGAALLFAAIVVIRARLLRRLARERRLAERWQPLFAECAEQIPAALPPIDPADAREFLLLWCKAQESLRGRAQERLVALAKIVGARDLAKSLLEAANPRRQLLGMVVLGHLRDASFVPRLEKLSLSSASLTSITAAHALLRIQRERALPRILAAAARRDDWPLPKIASILTEADAARVGPMLAEAIRSELRLPRPGPGIARLLRLHGVAHAEAIRPAVLEVLHKTADPEALGAALGGLWHPSDAPHPRRLLPHPSWVVRVAAARTLGRLGSKADFALLAPLLADESWWVRYRAAQALCALPGTSDADLRDLGAGLTDRFASDILAQAMADRAAA